MYHYVSIYIYMYIYNFICIYIYSYIILYYILLYYIIVIYMFGMDQLDKRRPVPGGVHPRPQWSQWRLGSLGWVADVTWDIL